MIKVVIVEDENLIRKGMILTTPWEQLQCQVIGEASNGLEGKNIIAKLKPDIVITDVRMPKMDGIEMIGALKNSIDTEYIIISGYSEFEYAQQAVKLGVKDYLLKPVDDDEFYKAINKVVQNIKQKNENEEKKYLQQENKTEEPFFKEYSPKNNIGTKQKYIVMAVKEIKTSYYKDITIKNVADKLYISESYLSRLFKNETGYTFVEYLTYYRIKKAIELLKDYTIKICEAAELVGFHDSRYFSVIFKKYIGVTPTKYKNNLCI